MKNLTQDELIQERKELCAKLRQARKDKGLSLEQVADAIGVHFTVISKNELAYTAFSIDTLIKLCRLYEIQLTV